MAISQRQLRITRSHTPLHLVSFEDCSDHNDPRQITAPSPAQPPLPGTCFVPVLLLQTLHATHQQ